MGKAFGLLCALAVSGLAANIRLVENGKSNYAIAIAPDASESERHGAEELQKFLEEMSGARQPITLLWADLLGAACGWFRGKGGAGWGDGS